LTGFLELMAFPKKKKKKKNSSEQAAQTSFPPVGYYFPV